MRLKINDKEWKLVWGLGALENLCNELGIGLQDVDMAILNNETIVLNKLTYCALQNGAEIDDLELDFNYKKFTQFIDNADESVGREIMNDFMKSKLLGKTMEERYQEIIERINASASEEIKIPKKKVTRSVKSLATSTSGDTDHGK
jgi:hypothetical protein